MAAPKTASRIIQKQIEIAAPVDAVWKALTDAAELARWFPLEARIDPKIGGEFFLSWGPQCEGTGKVSVWEVNRRFGWTEPALPPPEGAVGDGPQLAAVEWVLETRGGKTVVRVVNSGIADADWANEYHDSLDYGWGFMLANLRFYLEHHSGTPRGVAWPRRKVKMTREAAWRQLLAAPEFMAIAGLAQRNTGDACNVQLAGDRFDGTLEFVRPPRGFCIRATQHNGSLLWLSLEGGAVETEVGFWLSTYGVPEKSVQEFETRWRAALEKAFPA